MSNQTYQQVQRLDFLFNAGHSMLSMCPSLSRYYMNEFQNTLTEYELTASKPIARLSCTSCGQILIPGLTSKTEIIPKPKQKNPKQRKNQIKITCLACHHNKLYNGSFKEKMPRNETMTTNKKNEMNSVITNANKATLTRTVANKTAINKTMTTKTTISKTVTTNKNNNTKMTPVTTEITKKKKNKKNNLKALLLKQQQNQNSSTGSGGGLSDFLSSL